MKKLILIIFTLIIGILASGADLSVNGFIEQGLSSRYESTENVDDDLILSEVRARLDVSGTVSDDSEFVLKLDIIQDQIENKTKLNLKEAYIWIMPSDLIEIKAGRQVLTWGTGDLMFINDIFPKDYKSFFYGRDISDMKASSDAIKLSAFPEKFILDLVFIPNFNENEYIDGSRFTYYNPLISSFIKPGTANRAKVPEKKLENMEIAARIKRNIKSLEFALYGYKGFNKNPNMNSDYTEMEYSEIQLYGTSVVGKLLGGIFNIEIGYEDSLDDKEGDIANISNSYFKGIIGYKREILRDLSIGLQYQIEHMMNYDEYKKSMLVDYEYLSDEERTLLSIRITKLLKQQTIRAGLFTYYSPSDEDGYINPNIDYDWTDGLKLSFGGNIFYGNKDYTFFGQLEDNSNVYTRLRYSF